MLHKLRVSDFPEDMTVMESQRPCLRIAEGVALLRKWGLCGIKQRLA